jgi:hypothetical protein
MDKLQEEFIKKERAEIYLLNLEKMKSENSLPEDFYESLKSQYSRERTEAVDRIGILKADIRKKINDFNEKLALARLNYKYYEVKHKVGQLSEDEFSKQSKEPWRRVDNLEKTLELLNIQVAATASSDLEAPAAPRKLGINLPGLKKPIPKPYVPEPTQIPEAEMMEAEEEELPEVLPVTASVGPVAVTEDAPVAIENLPLLQNLPGQKRHLPPNLAITGLNILPEKVISGNDVGIIVELKNIGNDEITYKLELRVNDDIKDYQDIWLAPGNTDEVTFVVPAGPPGDYQIDIDGQSGKFRVLQA